ncbi:hypothetical protein C900_00502 [Fulvivirga imtechensis AK7]|uniref:Helix-turn-helix type 11 domain-containing protein n=2 Tax=Fulvivirga TaxID=396811 RepID=L8JW23_9BACT|nr:hypothetical protein C900_00502 [Fulvivirga imtechensis AK7]
MFYLDELIKSESTGTVTELAEKLNISKRHVYNYLNIFNEIGRINRYDESKRSFVYENL